MAKENVPDAVRNGTEDATREAAINREAAREAAANRDAAREAAANSMELLASAVGSVAKGTAKAVKIVGKGVYGTAKVAGKAVGAVSGAFDKTFGDAEMRHYKREQKYLSKRVGKKFLIIQKDSKTSDHFTVYSTDEEIKYRALGQKSPSLSSLSVSVTGIDGKEAVSVNSVEGKTKYSVFRNRDIPELLININNTEFSVFSEQLSDNKEPYLVNPQGWIVKEEILGSSYSMYSGSTEIMHFSKRSGYDWPTYILDFGDPKKEKICLAIVLTVIQLKCK